MKCAEIHALLPEVAGGEASPKQRALALAHVDRCALCADRLRSLQDTIGTLGKLGREVQAPEGFAQTLHQRLAKEPPPSVGPWQWIKEGLSSLLQGPRGLGVGFALGLSAAGLLFLVQGPSLGRLGQGGSEQIAKVQSPEPDANKVAAEVAEIAPFQVPAKRVAVVHFDFVTDAVVDDVQFEVTLPTELAFISDGQALKNRTLSWNGTLKSGSNPIPVAVSGKRPGRYHIVARARGEGVDVKHNVVLEVVSS